MSFESLGKPITDVLTSPSGQEVFENKAGLSEDVNTDTDTNTEVVNEDQQFQTDETGQTELVENEDTDSKNSTTEKLAGKFKNVDELVKGYKNLEKQFHQSRQPQNQQNQQPNQPAKSTQEINDAIWQAMNENPAEVINYFVQQGIQQALNPIKQKEADTELKNNLEDLSKTYPEINNDTLGDLFVRAKEIASEFGNINLAESKRILKMAAQELYPKSTAKLYKQALEEGKQEVLQNIQNKQNVNTNNGLKPTKQPNNTAKTPAQIIIEGIRNASQKPIF